MSTNVFVRDLDIADHARLHGRRLEVVADGLTLRRGAQLAIDTTLVSPLPSGRVSLQQDAHHQWSSVGEGSPQEGADGSSPVRGLDPSRACGSSMDPPLELHLGLQQFWSADQPLAREPRSTRWMRCSETQGLCGATGS